MAYTARVFYCSGGTVSDYVQVTMTEEFCPTWGTIYDDGICVYETNRKNLYFSLSKSVDFIIRLRFPVAWSQIVDGGTPSTGTQIHQIDIPAGLTYYTWAQFDGQEWRCKETRTCSSGEQAVQDLQNPA